MEIAPGVFKTVRDYDDLPVAGRGSILPQADSPIDSIGLGGRSAYREPAEVTTGAQHDVGMGARNSRSYPFPQDECREGLWSNDDTVPTDDHFGRAAQGEAR